MSAHTSALLRALATRPIAPCPSTLEAFWEATRAVREEFPAPMLRAAACGLCADRLGFAFASGYQAALASLFGIGLHEVASLSATETTGARPRDIRTRLVASGAGFQLDGAKVFTTASPLASVLFVVATTGTQADGRPALKVARVRAGTPGLNFTRLDELPFVPEVPHAGVQFIALPVAAADVLEGDGYARYLKPFRTLEDLHVNAALLGYLVSLARRFAWPRSTLEALLALVTAGCALAALPADAPETHVALGGFLAQVRALVDASGPQFERVAPAELAHWNRDRPLLQVAERVRAQRLERAWQRLAES